MIQGQRIIERPPDEVVDRLRLAMAGGNFDIESITSSRIVFRHGTFMTESAPLLPKRGIIHITPSGEDTLVSYEVEVIGFSKYWMLFFAVLFCWAIFPPILAHRALQYHPRRLMDNLLQGI